MKIGDRCFVHGYIDEIRKDTIIVRNSGGYFGTAPGEVITVNDTAHPNWIPCIDRMPEESDDYLCTYGSLSGWFVDISIYEAEKKEFGFYSENEHGEEVWHPVTNVVAWMPLPEPAKLGGEQG